MTTALAPVRQFLHRQLISPLLWDRLTHRIVDDHDDIDLDKAEQIMDAALGFLKLCADHPDRRFSPTELVDIGWHTFILYTKSYAEFCEEYAGRFIHHEPNDYPGQEMTTGGAAATVAFMEAHRIAYDEVMWHIEKENCCGGTSCCQGSPSSREHRRADCDNGCGPGPAGNCTCS